ncbi:MAG TPA: homoserine O-acetyltransferase [Fimbriimonadaceae bacterium]|nr:homoserine O-acetyltransferase [Fimbriimonadaceae bacterium]
MSHQSPHQNIDPALFQENERTAPAPDERRYAQVGSLQCEAGGYLEEVTVAYETFGKLNAAADNAVLACHALSGDAHCIGWWERLIGPGKAIDTDRYFVIGTNALGGCQGTTGPASPAPDGRPYQTRFPSVTVGDMVEVQCRLLDQLGIERLLCVAGGSMGGMQALEWTVRKPGRVRSAFVTASAAAHSAMQIGFNEAARQAVMRDAKWNGGLYDPADPPNGGLAVARMIGHLSFLSEQAFAAKFGRRLQDKERLEYKLATEFQVESYLNYQGDKFTKRFDANSLLYLTKAIDNYELTSLAGSQSSYLFTSFTTDWLYPPHQSAELHEMALAAGRPSKYVNIDLPMGHDAFLLDGEVQGALVREFLAAL